MEHTDQAQKECAVAKFHNNHNNCNSSSKKSGSVVVIDSSVKAISAYIWKKSWAESTAQLGCYTSKIYARHI